MQECLAVGLGGFIGSILRYLAGFLPIGFDNLPVAALNGFPLKTFLINVTGAFLIGIIAAMAAKNPLMDKRWVLFLKVGICGGFTTFSTFALEIGELIRNGLWLTVALYAILSATCAVMAFFAGCAVGN